MELKLNVFYDIMLCSLLDSCHCSTGTCCLLLQGTVEMEAVDSSEMLVSTRLHAITFKKTVIFIVTAVKTSNLILTVF
jgi:hypothetical protein